MALEIAENFETLEQWQAWCNRNPTALTPAAGQAIAAAVRQSGLEDPFTGQHVPAAEVKINGDNYRETIRGGRFYSRTRAAIETLFDRKLCPGPIGPMTRIFATEAITDFALAMRGRFPRFIGSEYAPTLEERAQLFPIEHQDLQALSLDSDSFDVVMSNDVLEHVPDIDRALGEIQRVLRSGGVLIATFPFFYARESGMRKAELRDGKVHHLMPPEYHGNPARPGEGSLVFEIPGWDILARARAAGFDRAVMRFRASTGRGIAGKEVAGVFILIARRAMAQPRFVAPATTGAVEAKPRYGLAGLVGLPRSGTTLLASLLDVHSRCQVAFEPWNANRKTLKSLSVSYDEFRANFNLADDDDRLLVVKETTTHCGYIDAIDYLLRSTPSGQLRRAIVMLRDPLHIYCSMIDARRKWWGRPDLQHSPESFEEWATGAIQGLKRLILLAFDHPTIFVDYDSLVRQPQAALDSLMAELGFESEPQQLHFEKHLDRSKVRGDVGLATAPRAIDRRSTVQRQEEIAALETTLRVSRRYAPLAALRELVSALSAAGHFRASERKFQKLAQAVAAIH